MYMIGFNFEKKYIQFLKWFERLLRQQKHI
jgi:hypothetical protein